MRENIAQVYGGYKEHEFMAREPKAATKCGKKWNSKQFLVDTNNYTKIYDTHELVLSAWSCDSTIYPMWLLTYDITTLLYKVKYK